MKLSDATPLFESQHALRDPDEMIQKLAPYKLAPNVTLEQNTPNVMLYTFDDAGFYRDVRRRVAAHLKGSSSAKAAAPKGGAWLVCKSLFFLLSSFALLGASVRAKLTSTAGLYAFCGGFAMSLVTFTLMHDSSHFAAFTRSVEMTHVASRFSQTLIWWDHNSWQAHHVLQHHPFTGDVMRDPDTRHGLPFFCKVSQAYHCDIERPSLQFFTAITIMYSAMSAIYQLERLEAAIYQLEGWKAPDPGAMGVGTVSSLQTYALHGVLYESWQWWQWPVAFWWLVFSFALYRSARSRGVRRRAAATRLLVALVLLALGMNVCFSINILVDHDSLDSQLENQLEHGTSPSDWGELQVRGSANWAGPVWGFFFGGINYQIEHHLFPTISHCYYPEIAPIVRATAEEHQIPYTHFPTVLSGLASVHSQFAAAAAEAAAKDKMGTDGAPPAYVSFVQLLIVLPPWPLLLLCVGICTTAEARRRLGAFDKYREMGSGKPHQTKRTEAYPIGEGEEESLAASWTRSM